MKTALSSVLVLAATSLSASAGAATSQKVDQSVWSVSGLPSYVNMYIYVPDKLSAKPPILVASHHCQGTAATTYSETKSSFVAAADKNGFIIIFPEATGHNCWDVGSAKSLKHDGGGDTHAIAQMVRYTLTKYGADATRVYAFGGSSGAMMTQALMGVYPDIFAAGVAISGVPCGCWATDYSGDVAQNGQWSAPCAGGQVSKTAQQWGDLVRSMFPGYTGHRPRLQLWHGTADTTISYKNLGEAVKEWTNLLALPDQPTSTDSKFGGTHQLWKSQCGFGVFETFSVDGAGHDVKWDVNTAVSFLGLDPLGSADPEAAACPPTGGTGGAGNAAGGSASTGGASGHSAGGSGGSISVVDGGSNSGGSAGVAPAANGGGGATSLGGFAGSSSASGASAVGGSSAITGGHAGTFSAGGNGSNANGSSAEGCTCALAGRADHRGSRSALLAFAALALGVLRRSRRSPNKARFPTG